MTKHKSKPQIRPRHSRKHRRQIPIWNWVFIAIGVLAVIVLVYLALSQNTGQISVQKGYAKYEKGAFIVDVRSSEEFEQMHIPGSAHIPLQELQARLDEIPTDTEVLVVCLIGKRSQEGMQILRQAGYKKVYCLDGGLKAWQAAGYPLEP